jgi:hypothetical protein
LKGTPSIFLVHLFFHEVRKDFHAVLKMTDCHKNHIIQILSYTLHCGSSLIKIIFIRFIINQISDITVLIFIKSGSQLS